MVLWFVLPRDGRTRPTELIRVSEARFSKVAVLDGRDQRAHPRTTDRAGDHSDSQDQPSVSRVLTGVDNVMRNYIYDDVMDRFLRWENGLTIIIMATLFIRSAMVASRFSPNAVFVTSLHVFLFFLYVTWKRTRSITLTPFWMVVLTLPIGVSYLLFMIPSNGTLQYLSDTSCFLAFALLPVSFLVSQQPQTE